MKQPAKPVEEVVESTPKIKSVRLRADAIVVGKSVLAKAVYEASKYDLSIRGNWVHIGNSAVPMSAVAYIEFE